MAKQQKPDDQLTKEELLKLVKRLRAKIAKLEPTKIPKDELSLLGQKLFKGLGRLK